MRAKTINLIFKIVLLLLLQIWVFNDLYLFRYASPYPYLTILLLLPIATSKITCTFLGGILGLLLDIFSGLPGFHTASFTLVAFARNYLLIPFVDADTNISKSISLRRNTGRAVFLLFEFIIIHHLILFGLDALEGFNFRYIALRFVSSVAFTFVLSFILLLLLADNESEPS